MLAWLQKERSRGGVAFRTTVFLVLSAAFNRTLHGRLLSSGEANGYAVLRELDRLLECQTPTDFQWGIQEKHEMRTPPTQHLYLIDGQRGEGANQHLNRYDSTVVCPPAVADAIYAHLLPSAGSDLTSYLANVQEHAVGRPDLYSTFGVYVVEYAWDPLIRGFGARAAAEVVDKLLTPPSAAMVQREKDRFLAGVAVVGGVEAPPPLLVMDLAGEAAKAGSVRPRREWLYPPGEAIPLPSEPSLAAAFPDLGAARTPYDGRFLVRRVEERVAAFWGDRAAEWSPAVDRQFHPVANRNGALAERHWSWAVRAVAADMMSIGGGGPGAGMAFLGAVRAELDVYRQRLEGSPAPNVDAARARLAQAKERAVSAGRFGRASAQRAYLEQAQRVLVLEVQNECRRRGRQLIERLIDVVDNATQEATAWQVACEEAARSLAETREQAVEERKRLEEVPLRRLVPRLTQTQLEDQLYRECAGVDVPAGLPLQVARVLDQVRWSVAQQPLPTLALSVVGGGAGWHSIPATEELVRDLLSQTTPLFVPLRTRSVFEVLGKDGQDGTELAQELFDGGAWLARYDKGEHDRYIALDKADSQLQEKRYAFAQWPAADSAGGSMAGVTREYLSQQGVETHDIESPEQGVPRPVSDKIVYLAARHRLLLKGFNGFVGLRESYHLRRGAALSPHVLREEKGAARLEALSESLVDRGLCRSPLPELSGRQLAYCADVELLRAVSVGLSNETLRVKVDDRERIEGWWVSTAEGDEEVSDGARLGDLLLGLAAGRTAVDRRRRRMVLEAANEARRYPDCTERTHRWFAGSPSHYVDKDLWIVLAVAAHLEQ